MTECCTVFLAILLAAFIPMASATGESAGASISSAGAGLMTLAATAIGLQPTQVGVAAATVAAAAITARIVIPDYISPSTRVKVPGEAKFARSGGTLRWTTVKAPGNCGV